MKNIVQRIYLTLLIPLVVFAGNVALLGYLLAILYSPKVAWNTAMSLDQAANAGAAGDPDESISSRAGKARRNGDTWGCVLCKFLDAIVPGHCAEAIEEDEGHR